MAKVKGDGLAIRLGGSAIFYISPKTVLGLFCGQFYSLNLVEFCMRKLTVHAQDTFKQMVKPDMVGNDPA